MDDHDTVWTRGGTNIEELPDPFAPNPPPIEPEAENVPPRRRWRPAKVIGLTALAVFVMTFVWLVFTAPLSRALEPLPDPARLFLSDDGKIALAGADVAAWQQAQPMQQANKESYASRGDQGAVRYRDSVGVGMYRIDLHPSTGGDPYIDLGCCPFQLPLGALVLTLAGAGVID